MVLLKWNWYMYARCFVVIRKIMHYINWIINVAYIIYCGFLCILQTGPITALIKRTTKSWTFKVPSYKNFLFYTLMFDHRRGIIRWTKPSLTFKLPSNDCFHATSTLRSQEIASIKLFWTISYRVFAMRSFKIAFLV